MVAIESLVAVIAVALLRVRAPAPTATVGLTVPPGLLNVTLFSVFVPIVRFRTPPPLIVTSVDAAICWLLVFCVTVALLIVRPPAGMTTVAAVAVLRFSVPWLTVVPPV